MNRLTAHKSRIPSARVLRRQQTKAEDRLWMRLRDKRLGYKFNRQYPIGTYFADFCCRSAKLIVEVDGQHHEYISEQDANRTYYLMTQGYRVLRFWNDEVFKDLDSICDRISEALRTAV